MTERERYRKLADVARRLQSDPGLESRGATTDRVSDQGTLLLFHVHDHARAFFVPVADFVFQSTPAPQLASIIARSAIGRLAPAAVV